VLVLPFSVHSVTVVFDRALRTAIWLLMLVYLPRLRADASDCAPLPSQTKFLTFLFWNWPVFLPKQVQVLWNMFHCLRLCNWDKSSSLRSQRICYSTGWIPTWCNGTRFSVWFYSSVFVGQQWFGNNYYVHWSANFSPVISYWSFLIVLFDIIFLLTITSKALPWILITVSWFNKYLNGLYFCWSYRYLYWYLPFLCQMCCICNYIRILLVIMNLN